jgi:hypothetical protein
MGSAQIPEVSGLENHEYAYYGYYLDEVSHWKNLDMYNELKEHLDSGYSEIYRQYFNELGIKERIDKYNKDISDLMIRIKSTFVYDLSGKTQSTIEYARARIHSLLNECQRNPHLPLNLENLRVHESSNSTALTDKDGSVILAHSDKKKVEGFRDLIDQELPQFFGELKNLLDIRNKILVEYADFQSELRAHARLLKQNYKIKGKCRNCP